MAVTSLDEILQTNAPQEIVLSGFQPGEELRVLVRRPGFYSLMARGAIPNPLIPEMEKLFVHRDCGSYAVPSEEFAETLVYIARMSLVSPSYEELQANGIELTDDQLVEISMYAAAGAEALRTFRERLRAAAGEYGPDVSNAAQQIAADR